ncbi:MAG: hypothetical protein ABI041_20780, partial [Bdellovibrionia bacterium]
GAHALELVRKMFLAGEAEDGGKTPGTLEEHIAYALDGLREKIFREIVAFEGPDVEPAHVETYYRNKLSRQLGVSQGISDPSRFADSKRHRIIPITDFVHRFFNGFKGDPSSSPENRKSNRGYTPESILAEVIDYIDQNPQVFGNEDLLNFFKKGLKPSQVRDWAKKHRDVVLGYLLLNDGTEEEKKEAFSSLSDDVLESAYVNHLYLRTWDKESTRRIPTQLGMRELLTRTGHLISQKH